MSGVSEALFELIKSLTQNEKGYFKRHAKSNKAKSNLVELFDVIDGLEEYDEGYLLKHFKGRNVAKHLSRSKNALYDAILSSLRSFHAHVFARDQLRQMLSEIEVLMAKGLNEQCYRRIILAKKKAVKYGSNMALIDLLLQELKVVYYVVLSKS